MTQQAENILLGGLLMMVLAIYPWANVFGVAMARSVTAGWVVASGMWLLAGLYLGRQAELA